MDAQYRLDAPANNGIYRTDTGNERWFPTTDPANSDYITYQAWLADGGVPDPYVPPEPGPPPPPSEALVEAQRANDRLDAGIAAAASGGLMALDNLPPVLSIKSPTDPVTQEQFDALQAQTDALEDTVRDMLQAQAGVEPGPT